MQEYPDARDHFNRHMDRAAKRYASGLQRAGLQPNDRLNRAMTERAIREAREDYQQQMDETLIHNIGHIMRDHERDMNRIKREGARKRLLCIPIALLFGGMCWYEVCTGDMTTAIVFAVGSLVFLAILVGGAIFDRPSD